MVKSEFEKKFKRKSPAKSSFQKLLKRFHENYSLDDKRKSIIRKRSNTKINSENVVNKLKEVFEEQPTISIRRAILRVKNQVVDVSFTTAQRVLKKHKFKPYKITKKHRLLPKDYDKRIDFANFILIKVDEDNCFVDKLIFSDEAWFSLSCDVNSQNCRFWSQKNPFQYYEVPLHDQEVMVWAAITSSSVVGPIFLTQKSINTFI